MSDPIQIQGSDAPADTGGEGFELPLTETQEPSADDESGASGASGAPQEGPQGPPAFFERSKAYGQQRLTGWRERQRQLHQEAARAKALEERYGQIEARNRELLQAATDLLKGQAKPEEFPDPTLDPQGFLAWHQKTQGGALQEALKPLLDQFTSHNEAIEQFRADQQAEAERQEFIASETQSWQTAIDEYRQQEPELAAGAEERFVDFRQDLSEAFGDQRLADWFLGKLGTFFKDSGYNHIAELDRVISQLYYGIAERFRSAGLMTARIEPGMMIAPAAGAGNGNGNGAGRPAGPPPIRTEAQRLAEVRRRTAPAASAAPQEPASGQAAGSPAKETYDRLLKAGQLGSPQGMKALKLACLKETGFNEREAALLMGSLTT